MIVIAGFGLAGLDAQEPAPAVQDALVEEEVTTTAPVAPEAAVAFQAHVFRNVLGLDVEFEGAVGKAMRMGKPWQLFNPFAPVEYGDGFDNVTIDPESGEATGLSLFGIRF